MLQAPERDALMIHLVAPLLFIWCGLLIGVSFVATPAKFLAPSLQLPQALDVGRWTFHVLTLIEWGLLAVAGLLIWVCRTRAWPQAGEQRRRRWSPLPPC